MKNLAFWAFMISMTTGLWAQKLPKSKISLPRAVERRVDQALADTMSVVMPDSVEASLYKGLGRAFFAMYDSVVMTPVSHPALSIKSYNFTVEQAVQYIDYDRKKHFFKIYFTADNSAIAIQSTDKSGTTHTVLCDDKNKVDLYVIQATKGTPQYYVGSAIQVTQASLPKAKTPQKSTYRVTNKSIPSKMYSMDYLGIKYRWTSPNKELVSSKLSKRLVPCLPYSVRPIYTSASNILQVTAEYVDRSDLKSEWKVVSHKPSRMTLTLQL
jgi:hypothetical protein